MFYPFFVLVFNWYVVSDIGFVSVIDLNKEKLFFEVRSSYFDLFMGVSFAEHLRYLAWLYLQLWIFLWRLNDAFIFALFVSLNSFKSRIFFTILLDLRCFWLFDWRLLQFSWRNSLNLVDVSHLSDRSELYLQICLYSIIMIYTILMYEDHLISSLSYQVSQRYCEHSKRKAGNVIKNIYIDNPVVHELNELHKLQEIVTRLIVDIDLNMHNLIRTSFCINQHNFSCILVDSH